jgi:hypothetical protein
MVGTATALLAAGCAATGTTSTAATRTAGTGSGAPSSPAAPDVTGTALGGGAPTSTAPASTAPAGTTPADTATSASQATVYGCDQQPVAQPKTYVLSCGDGGVVLGHLVWTGWGQAKASATGAQTQNSCVPTCAAGSPISTKASVTLSGLAAGHYTKMHVVTAKGASDYTIDAQGPLMTAGN